MSMKIKDIANVCLTPDLSSFSDDGSFEYYLWRYLFPPVFLIGVLGNVAELFVLFSPGMRNRANNLLAAMAIADGAFLLFMLPHSLANYSIFEHSYSFRFVYFYMKHELIALANWSSAAAIWLVLAVCVDRLLGIKSPLYSCKEWSPRKISLLFLGIILASGLLTAFHHVAYECFYWRLCNGTQIHSKCFSVTAPMWRKNETNPKPQWLRNYIRTGTTFHALFGIILPTWALIALNVALVRELKKRSNQPLLATAESVSSNCSHGTVQRRQERRVTVTVCAIVCCFILTQGPSSILMLWNMFGSGYNSIIDRTMFEISRTVNFLTAIGKSSNFFLFCFISSSFRKRLRKLLIKKKRKSTVLAQIRRLSRHHRNNNDSMTLNSPKLISNYQSSPMTASTKFHASTSVLNSSSSNSSLHPMNVWSQQKREEKIFNFDSSDGNEATEV